MNNAKTPISEQQGLRSWIAVAISFGVVIATACDGPPGTYSVIVAGAVASQEVCGDLDDNDLDGRVDCIDPDCAAESSCSATVRCDGAIYQLYDEQEGLRRRGVWARVDTSTTPFSVVVKGVLDATISASCYNVGDGRFYGFRSTDQHLIRWDANAEVEDLGAVRLQNGDALPEGTYDTGDCDGEEQIWLKQRGRSMAYVVGFAGKHIARGVDVGFAGTAIAYDPSAHRLFGVAAMGDAEVLHSYDIDNAKHSTRSIRGASLQGGGESDSVWLDADGYLYIYSESSANVRQLDVTTGEARWAGTTNFPSGHRSTMACAWARSAFERCANGVDDDGDGSIDEFDLDAGQVCVMARDSDGDGILDADDTDDDNDGIADIYERGDADRDGIVDRLDLDSDNDGVADADEAGILAVGALSNPLRAEGSYLESSDLMIWGGAPIELNLPTYEAANAELLEPVAFRPSRGLNAAAALVAPQPHGEVETWSVSSEDGSQSSRARPRGRFSRSPATDRSFSGDAVADDEPPDGSLGAISHRSPRRTPNAEASTPYSPEAKPSVDESLLPTGLVEWSLLSLAIAFLLRRRRMSKRGVALGSVVALAPRGQRSLSHELPKSIP